MLFIRFFSVWVIFTAVLYASVGKVSLLKGDAFVLRSSQTLSLQTGSKIDEKDTVSTGKTGQIQITFEDKTVITLGNSSTFKIEEYLNQEQKPKAKFSFAQGTFKTITGKIGKRAPENFTLETKTATIGIRGTIIRGKLGERTDKIMCEKGAIGVRSHVTGREVLVTMGRVIVLPHDAPPLPVRDVQPSDLAELSLNDAPPPPDAAPANGSNPSDNPPSGGDQAPLSADNFQLPSNTPPPSTPLFSQAAPLLQNFTPEVANTALETSFETQQQETVTEEILTQECPSGTTGIYPDCVALTCPVNTTGIYPDCVPLTCPVNTTGIYPDCVALTCPVNTTGTYPDCVALTCPVNTTGTYPDCVALTCPSNTTGIYPDCVSLTCPSGTTGTYPDCVALTCPSGTTGTYPNCFALTCPSGTSGTYPNCVADYVPPTIYNSGRNAVLSGKMLHRFEDIGNFYGIGTGSYTLVQNTLSTQSGGNPLYFYDVGNSAVSPPYEFKTVEWSVSLPNTQAGTLYSGYSNLGTIVPAMTFTSPDGSVSIASSVAATLYSDNMQQFFLLYYSTNPNVVDPYGKVFNYGEWFGTITPYASLGTLFPNREVVIYRSPVDSEDVVTVNYGNNHFLDISMGEGVTPRFSIGIGRIGSDESVPAKAILTGQDMSGYYDFSQLEVGTGISGYIYGDKAQGAGGSGLVQNSTGTSYNIGGAGFYRDTTLTTSLLTGDLAFTGYANAIKSDWSAYPAATSNFTFTMNRDTGILGSSSIDLMYYTLGTVTFQDGTGDQSAYINDDYFATLGAVGGKGYLVALDTYPPATDDYVSWGYWGYIDNVSVPTLTIVPSTWVGGVESNATAHIQSLIGDTNTPITTYSYSGNVIGDVNTGSGHYAIDTTTNYNAVKLDFDFGGGVGSLKNTSYIQFQTTASTPQAWKIYPSVIDVTGSGFTASNTNNIELDGVLQDGATHPGSSSVVKGKFYGPDARSVGGTFSATTDGQGAIGVFKGVRP